MEKTKNIKDSEEDNYIKAFKSLENTDKNSWCLEAFLGGECWFFYRGMPFFGVLCLIFYVITLFVIEKIFMIHNRNLSFFILNIILLLLRICLGFFGNRFFFEQIKQDIAFGEHLPENNVHMELTPLIIESNKSILYLLKKALTKNVKTRLAQLPIYMLFCIIVYLARFFKKIILRLSTNKSFNYKVSEENMRLMIRKSGYDSSMDFGVINYMCGRMGRYIYIFGVIYTILIVPILISSFYKITTH